MERQVCSANPGMNRSERILKRVMLMNGMDPCVRCLLYFSVFAGAVGGIRGAEAGCPLLRRAKPFHARSEIPLLSLTSGTGVLSDT